MIDQPLRGTKYLLMMAETMNRLEASDKRRQENYDELRKRVDQLARDLEVLTTRMDLQEQVDRVERENLILQLRLELAQLRNQLPPAGGSQTHQP